MSEQTISLAKLNEVINKGKSSSAIQREVISLKTAFAQRILIYKTKSVNTMLNEIFRNSRSVRSIPATKADKANKNQGRISCYSLRFESLKSIKDVADQADAEINILKSLYDELGANHDDATEYTEPRNVRVIYQSYETKVYYDMVRLLDQMMMMMDYARLMGALDEVTEKEMTKRVTSKIEAMLRGLLHISDRIVRERKNKFPKIKNKEGRNIPDRERYPGAKKKRKKKTQNQNSAPNEQQNDTEQPKKKNNRNRFDANKKNNRRRRNKNTNNSSGQNNNQQQKKAS